MNWVRNNRFLATFLGIVIVVGGLLTFLLFSAYGRYADVSTQYNSQVTELKRLQGLSLYPNAENLKKYEDVRTAYQQAVNDLQTKMASLEPPAENPPPTPLQFQDRLRQVVDETVRHAQSYGVGLPDGFYLGFEQYRGAPPETAATPLLSKQLNSIQNLVDLLINQHIEKITAIKRGLLPQEGGAAAAAANSSSRPGSTAAPTPSLVAKYPLEVAFTTLPSSFRESINKITSDKNLYVIRALEVKNQMDKGPSRMAEGPGPGGVGPGAPPAAGGGVDASGVPVPPLPDKGPPPLRYIVGQERLDVIARIDMASVKPLAAAAH